MEPEITPVQRPPAGGKAGFQPEPSPAAQEEPQEGESFAGSIAGLEFLEEPDEELGPSPAAIAAARLMAPPGDLPPLPKPGRAPEPPAEPQAIPDEPHEPADGLGFLPSAEPGPGQSRDIGLAEKALRERWPISGKYREAIIRRLLAIALSPNSGKREVVAASRALLQADKMNLEEQAADAAAGALPLAAGMLGLAANPIKALNDALLHNPAFQDVARSIVASRDPRLLCILDGGRVAPSEAPSGTGPGGNGRAGGPAPGRAGESLPDSGD